MILTNLRASDAGERVRIVISPQRGGNEGQTGTCRKRMMITPCAIEDENQYICSRIRFHRAVARSPHLPLLPSMGTILNTVQHGGQIRFTRTQSWVMMNLVRIKKSPTRLQRLCFKLPSILPEMLCTYCSRHLAGVRTFSFNRKLRVPLVSLPERENPIPRASFTLRDLSRLSHL